MRAILFPYKRIIDWSFAGETEAEEAEEEEEEEAEEEEEEEEEDDDSLRID